VPHLLILGAGWVGDALRQRFIEAAYTHRSPSPGAIEFDLDRASTWANLPEADDVVWTFPAEPPELVVRLHQDRLAGARALVVLGSTSAYLTRTPDEEVTEETPPDLRQPRVAGEEALRSRGATVLALAGLHGPGRDPARWLLSGRIANGLRYANLAHLSVVLAAVEAVLARPLPGERVNVCDGEPMRWSEHVRTLRAQGRLPAGFRLPEAPPDCTSRRVSCARLRALMGPAFPRPGGLGAG